MVDMHYQPTVAKAPAGRPRTTDPTWIVTAPHAVPRSLGRGRAPWGDYHLRPDGEMVTACGLSTMTWISFWSMKPSPMDIHACHVCRSAVSSRISR